MTTGENHGILYVTEAEGGDGLDITVRPGRVAGEVGAIPSKSHAQRLLIAAALSKGDTLVGCPVVSRDIQAVADCLNALCADVKRTAAGYIVSPRKPTDGAVLPCGESGAALRFLLPVACALGVAADFVLDGRLPERPIAHLAAQLRSHGAVITGLGGRVLTVKGRISGGRYALPGDISSQYVTGLCFALPLLPEGGEIRVLTELQSRGYVDMTLQTLEEFGIRATFDERGLVIPGGQAYHTPGCSQTEGDWSAAAFWLCAAAADGDVRVTGLRRTSRQGDRAILDILAKMNASVCWEGADCVRVRSGKLRGRVIDVRNTPDIAPALAVAALAAWGGTRIVNIDRLRYKESNRINSVIDSLRAIGAKLYYQNGGIVVSGDQHICGGKVDARGDHRVAMMLACCAAVSQGDITISGAEAVAKSYPAFFEDMKTLRHGAF